MGEPYGYIYMTQDLEKDKFYFGQHRGMFNAKKFRKRTEDAVLVHPNELQCFTILRV